MFNRLLPWRWIVSRLARSRGFIDPVALLGRLQRFAQPSEVSEPIELLRAGVAFHARGLLNARAIQHNLDWVWPFWVERQFDPYDVAFVPRAFSITHVNLTHRNWTAVGWPDLDWLPIVDPRGLATPLFDGWSIDAGVLADDGQWLLPSRAPEAEQRLQFLSHPTLFTRVRGEAADLQTVVDLFLDEGRPCCRVRVTGRCSLGGSLVLSLRPANPEGVSLVHRIDFDSEQTLTIEGASVRLSRRPDRVCMSEYHRGDVLRGLAAKAPAHAVECNVGLATAAAVFRLAPGQAGEVTATVPMPQTQRQKLVSVGGAAWEGKTWERALRGACRLEVPDPLYQFLFDSTVRTLVLHSPGDVYPGPFTYKRFWFRDAAFILDALLAAGMPDRVHRAIDRFGERQDHNGYFRSQEGEWDSNGAALWAMDRYRRAAGAPLPREWLRAAAGGADWICRKRLPADLPEAHAGLLPAGFSAEHLGLNDFYFWDDFWCAAGLRAAAGILRASGEDHLPGVWEEEADKLLAAVDKAIARSEPGREGKGVPASPYRRMDAGAIGSLAAGYPLGLWAPDDARLLKTAGFLIEQCSYRGGFFQDMIHSGVNAYLTLHIAQVLLRAGDPRHEALTRATADLASPTGQWPEAIHPATLGGCMGDGQHVWAAAEWVLMMRSIFLREGGDRLVVGSGLPRKWLEAGVPLRFGPTLTGHGPVAVEVAPEEGGVRVSWEAGWRDAPPPLELAVGGCERMTVSGKAGRVVLSRVRAESEVAR
jgi:hypothetical protein